MLWPPVVLVMLLDVRTIELAPGDTHLKRPMEIPPGLSHVVIRGNAAGSTLVLDADFQGSAAIVLSGATDVTLTGFAIRGNRSELKSDWSLPLQETAFADFYSANGILARMSSNITIRDVSLSRIRAFPILINASSDIVIDGAKIEDSGTLNRAGRNNTTGGILLEEGVTKFEVRRSTISRITGNAIWTHSYSRSPRQADGVIRENTIDTVGRDAIQVGHATRIRVENNTGANLGFPTDYVDVETHAVAVAVDTAGNVDHAVYANNSFTDVNGQCIDLDGFHDGEVTGNSCINKKPLDAYPALHYGIVFGNNDPATDSSGAVVTRNTLQGFAYGAVFLVGSANRIENNRFLDVNRAHCGATPVTARCNYALDQPDLLRSGIYLSKNGGRPAKTEGNVIRYNVITGFGIPKHCITAESGVSLAANTVSANVCTEP